MSFVFPSLAVPIILKFFNDWYPSMAMTDNDFKNPQKERWYLMYQILMQEITGNSLEQLTQRQMVSGNLDYPELYEGSMALFTLTLTMQRILVACGLQDFTMTDIIEPQPKRCVTITSALINYLYFRDERQQVFNRIKDENNAQLEQRKEIQRQNDELRQKIANIKKQRSEQEGKLAHLQDAVSTKRAVLEEKQKKVLELQKGTSELKLTNNEKKTAITKVQETLARKREENAQLSRKIVQSPERVKADTDRLKRQLATNRAQKDEKQHRLVEIEQRSHSLQKQTAERKEAVDLLKDLQGEIDKEKGLEKQLAAVQNKATVFRERLRDLEAQEEQTKKQISARHARHDKLALLNRSKATEQANLITSLQNDIEQLTLQQSSDQIMKRKMETEKEKLEQDMTVVEAKHEARMQHLHAKYSEVLEALDLYHLSLGTGWEKLKNFEKSIDS